MSYSAYEIAKNTKEVKRKPSQRAVLIVLMPSNYGTNVI